MTTIHLTLDDKELEKKFIQKAKEHGTSKERLLRSLLEYYVNNRIIMTDTNNEEDDIFTDEDKEAYVLAKKDMEKGINILSLQDLKEKYGVSNTGA